MIHYTLGPRLIQRFIAVLLSCIARKPFDAGARGIDIVSIQRATKKDDTRCGARTHDH